MMRNEVASNSNGRWTKGLIAGISLTAGLAAGAASMGVYAGTLRSEIQGHINNPLIHQTPEEKQKQMHEIIDREVAPTLVSIDDQLAEIRQALRHIQEAQK